MVSTNTASAAVAAISLMANTLPSRAQYSEFPPESTTEIALSIGKLIPVSYLEHNPAGAADGLSESAMPKVDTEIPIVIFKVAGDVIPTGTTVKSFSNSYDIPNKKEPLASVNFNENPDAFSVISTEGGQTTFMVNMPTLGAHTVVSSITAPRMLVSPTQNPNVNTMFSDESITLSISPSGPNRVQICAHDSRTGEDITSGVAVFASNGSDISKKTFLGVLGYPRFSERGMPWDGTIFGISTDSIYTGVKLNQ